MTKELRHKLNRCKLPENPGKNQTDSLEPVWKVPEGRKQSTARKQGHSLLCSHECAFNGKATPLSIINPKAWAALVAELLHAETLLALASKPAFGEYLWQAARKLLSLISKNDIGAIGH
jgi:hypothetical protein